MPASEGLKNSLNAIREISSTIYHQYIPIIDDTTDISQFANPLLEYPAVMNEFCSSLLQKIAYSYIASKNRFVNKFDVLEGDEIPLGYVGEEIYINPAKGRKYNCQDFAGLLAKYEASVKVQYMPLNMDTQYPVTANRQDFKKAFTSWRDLEDFISGLANSLYNGAYIDKYKFTKNIIAGSYKENRAVIQTVTAVTDESSAKALLEKLRTLYLNFQDPTSDYNAWNKMGGSGDPLITWTNPEDIILVIRNDVYSKLSVQALAAAFNRSDMQVLAKNIITVNNFDAYDDDGTKVFDGSNIVGILCDKRWFKIKRQDEFMDTFYNPNNRTLQMFLNEIYMYNYSLFANGVVLATAQPTVAITGLDFKKSTATVVEGEKIVLELSQTPITANGTVTFTSSADAKATVRKIDNLHVEVTGVDDGSATITATAGEVSDTCTVTITAAAAGE